TLIIATGLGVASRFRTDCSKTKERHRSGPQISLIYLATELLSDAEIAPGRRYAIAKVTNPNMTAHKGRWLARRLAAIVDNSADAIIGKDLNDIITSWNKGAERIFGYSAREMIGTSIMRLIPLERQAEEEEILSRIRRGERYDHFDAIRVTKDGRRLP